MEQQEEMAEYAVSFSSKLGFDYSEAFLENTTGFSYAIEEGQLNESARIEKSGIRIRLLKNGDFYTFSTNRINKDTIRRGIESYHPFNSVSTRLSHEKVVSSSYSEKEKEKVEPERMLEDLSSIDKEMQELTGIKYRSSYAGSSTWDAFYVNSEGTQIHAELPLLSSFFSVTLKNGHESRQRVFQYGSTGGYETFKIDTIKRQIREDSESLMNVMRNGVRLSKYELARIRKVVASPEIVGIAVHESVGHPCEADRVFMREAAQAGTSYLNKGNLGMQLGSEHVNIFDDPTIKGSEGFFVYDDEGVKARKKQLVKNGIQKELLTNREFAGLLGLKSNGSARSDSYSNEPLIRMSNTYLKKGSTNFEELIEEAGKGVYIKSFMEWNIDDTRSFSRYQGNEAFMIKNGEIGKPIKNYVLETSTKKFWSSVRMLGRDFKLYSGNCGKGEPMQGVPVSMGGPSVLLDMS